MFQNNQATTTDASFLNCNPHKVAEWAWECLEEKRCKFASSYGGEYFCKHPSMKQIASKVKQTIKLSME